MLFLLAALSVGGSVYFAFMRNYGLSLAYVSAGAIFLAALGVMAAMSRLRRSRGVPPPPPAPRQGVALILVLLLTALTVGVVIHAQVLARVALRLADARYARMELRLAATDAAWNEVRAVASGAALAQVRSDGGLEPVKAGTPAGIQTEVTLSQESNPGAYGVSRSSRLVPSGGRFFGLAVRAEKDPLAQEIFVLCHRSVKGEVRILRWVER